MTDCEADEGPCQVCMVLQQVKDLKDLVDSKLSVVQFLVELLDKALREARDLTKKDSC